MVASNIARDICSCPRSPCGSCPVSLSPAVMSSATLPSQVGKCLNFDEVTVYHEEAALPTFLIVYSFMQ